MVCRGWRAARLRRWIDRVTGMYQLHGCFDPKTGARIVAAIDTEVDSLRRATAVL